MEKRFIQSMNSEQRLWLAHGIIGVTMSDQVIGEGEFEFLQQIGDLAPDLARGKQFSPLYDMVVNKTVPPLGPLVVEDPKVARTMLITLIKVSASDGDMSSVEKNYLKQASDFLGLPPAFFEKSIAWGQAFAELTQKENLLIQNESDAPL